MWLLVSTLIEGRGLALLTFVGLSVGALEHAIVAVRDWLVDALTALVRPAVIGGQCEAGNRLAVRCMSQLRVTPEVSD